jgi:predicted acetyltransferase
MDVRPITKQELEAFGRCQAIAFGRDFSLEALPAQDANFEYDRSLATFDGGAIVGTAGIFTHQMGIPGGTLPSAGVTRVSVLPTHRRRGVLTGMMRTQLEHVRERGEAVATLWATESVIYGRFGYGLASEGVTLKLQRSHAQLIPGTPVEGRVRLVAADEAREQWPAIWEQLRARTPGMMSRSHAWWTHRVFGDPPASREGFTENRYANYEVDGDVRGYVRYRSRDHWDDGGWPDATLRVVELIALTDDAYRGLWEYVFGIDLVGTIEATYRPPDEPLYWMLADPRRLVRHGHDSLWLRILDVERTLSARRYSADGRVVLGVHDAFIPETGGTFALETSARGATCKRVTGGANVELGIQELGAAYLSGVRFETLARAGRVTGDMDAIRQLDRMFWWPQAPWCPEMF